MSRVAACSEVFDLVNNRKAANCLTVSRFYDARKLEKLVLAIGIVDDTHIKLCQRRIHVRRHPEKCDPAGEQAQQQKRHETEKDIKQPDLVAGH